MTKDEVVASSHDSKRLPAFDNTCFGIEELNNYRKSPTDWFGSNDDLCRSPGPSPASAAAGGPGELGSSPLLVTLLQQSDQEKTGKSRSFIWLRTGSQRRLRSRVYWGLQLPGRYYFWTFTNSGTGLEQKRRWKKLKKWLKRYRPGIAGIYCLTFEGNGVVHLVVRLSMTTKRMIKDEVEQYWNTLGGGFTFVRRVSESGKKGLADYLADQRRKRGMSKEMGCQTMMTSWNRLGAWLPVYWTRDFGRAWVRTNGMALADRSLLFKSWLLRYADDPDTWKPHVPLTWDNEVGWIDMLPDELELDKRFLH